MLVLMSGPINEKSKSLVWQELFKKAGLAVTFHMEPEANDSEQDVGKLVQCLEDLLSTPFGNDKSSVMVVWTNHQDFKASLAPIVAAVLEVDPEAECGLFRVSPYRGKARVGIRWPFDASTSPVFEQAAGAFHPEERELEFA